MTMRGTITLFWFVIALVGVAMADGPTAGPERGAVDMATAVETKEAPTQLEKETSLVNFDTIKSVLKKDQLTQEVQKKKDVIQEVKKEREEKKLAESNYPSEADFWPFCTELWLVRNAQLLKWDFQKPDYGVEKAFEALLKDLGFYEKRFRILFINGPLVPHIALPYGSNETLFLLSVPFMRAIDLTKMEISLLLLEDFFRMEKGYFLDAVRTKEVGAVLGQRFSGDQVNMKAFDSVLLKYTEFITKNGFTFQQQYDVTKRMDAVLKTNLTLWKTYFQLLQKIDGLTKSNLMFDYIGRLYPSPEMQIKWLTPKES